MFIKDLKEVASKTHCNILVGDGVGLSGGAKTVNGSFDGVIGMLQRNVS